MIDRIVLTEALARWDETRGDLSSSELQPLADAARLLLDFPTDEQVQALASYVTGDDPRLALEAVRDTMIADA